MKVKAGGHLLGVPVLHDLAIIDGLNSQALRVCDDSGRNQYWTYSSPLAIWIKMSKTLPEFAGSEDNVPIGQLPSRPLENVHWPVIICKSRADTSFDAV